MTGKKLLVADDSLTIQKVIRLALSNESYEIQTVSDGYQVLSEILLFKPHLILIDINLPNKSAFTLKEEFNQHAELHQTKFILMSSAFETVDQNQINRLGFHGQITKPFDPAHLRNVLLEVFNTPTLPPSEIPQETHSFQALNDFEHSTDLPTEEPEALSSLTLNSPINQPLKIEPSSTSFDFPPLVTALQQEHSQKAPPPPPYMMETLNKTKSTLSDPPPANHDVRKLTDATMRIMNHQEEPVFNQSDNILDVLEPIHDPLSDKSAELEINSLTPNDSGVSIETLEPIISASQLESLVTEHVEIKIQKMTQQILPEIMEKIIKQEIHKLLSEH